jgi:cyclin B
MYQHFREKEYATSVRPVYMESQPHINERMRSILVDWLVEVHLKFKLVPETLYLTVNLIDRYLERMEVSRPKLQLVGVSCLLIASKYEEM